MRSADYRRDVDLVVNQQLGMFLCVCGCGKGA